MTTRIDLDWWLELAPTLEWTFARTYADSAPHSYAVLGRTAGLARHDFIRAARVIQTFGQPGKFYGMTNIYLTSPDGRLNWWTMDSDLNRTDLINQAATDRKYGVQNAPSTCSGIRTNWDEIATLWDQLHPTSDEAASGLRGLVAAAAGKYPPSVLDVGCGTGRVLDLGVTTPDRYAGVDSSQAMLNQLVRKHPKVGAVYPMTIERAMAEGLFTPRQFEVVTAVGGIADDLSDDTLRVLARIASRAFIAMPMQAKQANLAG